MNARNTLRKAVAGLAGLAVATGCTMATASPAAAASSGYTFADTADWDRDGHQDIVTKDLAGDLWLYPGQSVRHMSTAARTKIGNGWNGYTFAGIADWDRDGHQDIVTRDLAGDLWLYPGQSVRHMSTAARTKIGNGWNGYTFAGIADWDRDGHQDIVTRDLAGDLWLYPGQSVRHMSTAARAKIGNGWNGYTFAGIADWDRDGHRDIVTKDLAGDLWLYPGQSVRHMSTVGRAKIGNGWNGYRFAGVSDWDRDGHRDIVTKDLAGDLWLYPGQSVRHMSTVARAKIGNGW